MTSNRDSPRNPSTPQSIPLQDLSRPPDSARSVQSDEEWGGRFRGTVSGRARALLGNRQSPQARRARYERVLERDVTEETQEASREAPSTPHIQTPRSAHSQGTFYEDGELSPVDIGGFQAAMGSVGLSLNDEPGPSTQPPLLTRTSTSGKTKLGIIAESVAAESPESPPRNPDDQDTNDDDYFAKPYDDQSPLTDNRYLQPMSGSQASTPSRKSIENRYRHSRQSSRNSPGSRLGADLGYTDASPNLRVPSGHHSANRLSIYSTRSISRSLSTTASPLTTAGSMLRKMSQRVVNLSNEPEVIETTRQPSTKHARMDAPPSFPAMTEYAHDEAGPSTPPPPEKDPPNVATEETREEWHPHVNPLKGKSLGIFGPNSRIRRALCEILVHPVTEPLILVLIVIQTIFLAVDAANPIDYYSRSNAWGSEWTNVAFVVLFIIYTLEILAHVVVSGLLRNADEYSSLPRGITRREAFWALTRRFFAPQDLEGLSTKRLQGTVNPQVSILRSFTTLQPDQPGHSRQQQRIRLARRAFLRHSFNRLDFLAVCSYWVFFILVEAEVEQNHHIWVFQMLSCLRILRLLNLTNGTSVILRSLKKAAPLLVNVAFLISFFMLLFAIIGSQAFKSSFRRTCVWFGDDIEAAMQGQLSLNSYTQNIAPGNIQFCGGYRHINGTAMSWVHKDLKSRVAGPKGFLCPARSMCVEGNNPYNGTVHFDDIFHSLELIFVIMSSNTFTDLLYYTTDSDYLLGAFFFAAAFVFMSLWLMNLLVAVITSSFQVIREETSVSAFTAEEPNFNVNEDEKPRKKSAIKRAFDKTFWLWITIIAFSLIVQSLRTADMNQRRENMISYVESAVTAILFLEILLRIAVDYRNFWSQRVNWVDLIVAVITVVIQMPGIRSHGQTYAWLTFFQIIRIYRVVLAVPITRNLITVVLKNVTGLLNLIVFVFLMTFLCSIFAIQLFRGEFPKYDVNNTIVRITFDDIYNSFIGMYQILSSENWTTSMYNATQYERKWSQGWIGAIFFILWFILANFIILNMFIAVIQESFDVSEDQKRLQQVKAFLQQRELTGSTQGTLSLATILKFGRDQNRYRDPLEYGPATMEMFKDAVVRDFLDEQMEGMEQEDAADDAIPQHDGPGGRPAAVRVRTGIFSTIWYKLTGRILLYEPNPFYTPLKLSKTDEELDPRTLALEYASATENRKRQQRQYLQNHTNYNVSFFLFKPHHPVRRFCQHMVGPGRGGQRVEGVDPYKPVWYAFSFFIYANVLAMVLIACVTTPLYQKEYLNQSDGLRILTWFFWTDASFAIVFTVEAFIKVIADGFFWTPNAYFRSSWGFIDGIVLVTLWVNVGTSLAHLQGVSRAVGAFKALRALRLLNISDSARETFHSIVRGGLKLVQAAFVSLSLLIPFAIYGLNLFNGQFLICNDTNSNPTNLSNCVGEWNSTPFNNDWPVLAPRQVSNPYYNFDDFGNSMFILFQIVSQEGWVDVMWSAMMAAGKGLQPMPFLSRGNSVFFIIFNLLGAVFVLTLFVSVFMRNITEQTGVAFLTAEQRSWLELRKLLRQISPSKRPSNNLGQGWKTFCYRIAVKKHGKWQRTVTAVLILHLSLLVAEFYPDNDPWENVRNYLFVAFTVFYIINIVIRIIGKSWKRFRRSSWDLFSLLAIAGTIITTILDFSAKENVTIYSQLHKLFLVSITLLLIPRNNQLDQLFKTAAASLGAISNLLATWLVLFLVFAIALTQTLGLTRFGSQGKPNLNFRNVPKALILLFRMSCGEGWNQIMEDYAQITSPLCVSGKTFYDSDCGSAAWARVLFIAWNIVSMYIFVSMFVSLIFESFSYVYQRSNGLSMVSRDEIRRFKEAWATFDPEGSGYISKEAFPRLLGELSGVFEMRIYDGDHTVGRILEDCRVELPPRGGTDTPPPPHLAHGVNIHKLNNKLASINVPEIRRRRARLELFSQEVLVTADPERGLSFTACLMILAHYNIILDKNSLRLEEFLRRRYRLQKVQEQVRLNVVKGFFDTLHERKVLRRRRELRHSARMVTVPQFAVPEIFVEGEDNWSTPVTDAFPQSPTTSRQGTLHQRRGSAGGNTSPLGSPKNKGPMRGLAALTTSIPMSPHGITFHNSFTSGRQRKTSVGSSPARSDGGGGSSFHASPIMAAQQGRRPSETSEHGDPFSLQVDGPSGWGSEHGSAGERSPTGAGNMWAQAGNGSRHGRTVSTQSVVRRGSESVTASGGGGLDGTLGMLGVGGSFDNSAWGESIRRSFTTRRRDRKESGG